MSEPCAKCAELQAKVEDLKQELQTWKNMAKWVATTLDVEYQGDIEVGFDLMIGVYRLKSVIEKQAECIEAAKRVLDNG